MTSFARRVSRNRAGKQSAVREGRLEATLENLNQEIGGKTAMVLHEFHKNYVRPLEERVEFLELPLHKRLWSKFQTWRSERAWNKAAPA